MGEQLWYTLHSTCHMSECQCHYNWTREISSGLDIKGKIMGVAIEGNIMGWLLKETSWGIEGNIIGCWGNIMVLGIEGNINGVGYWGKHHGGLGNEGNMEFRYWGKHHGGWVLRETPLGCVLSETWWGCSDRDGQTMVWAIFHFY